MDFETDEVDQEEDPEKNKIQSNDDGFQMFMLKATKIVTIFLKDKMAPQELVRSVLQFQKISVNLLKEEHLKEGGISKLILETLFQGQFNHLVAKHKLQIRKIV